MTFLSPDLNLMILHRFSFVSPDSQWNLISLIIPCQTHKPGRRRSTSIFRPFSKTARLISNSNVPTWEHPKRHRRTGRHHRGSKFEWSPRPACATVTGATGRNPGPSNPAHRDPAPVSLAQDTTPASQGRSPAVLDSVERC